VYNDLGSGSNVDLCVITKDGVDYLRNYELLMGKTYKREFPVNYPKGTAREWGGGRAGRRPPRTL
jgi:20S proteasome subunit beta 2